MNFLAASIVVAIVLGHSFNKITDFWLVQIVFPFVFITVTRSSSKSDKKFFDQFLFLNLSSLLWTQTPCAVHRRKTQVMTKIIVNFIWRSLNRLKSNVAWKILLILFLRGLWGILKISVHHSRTNSRNIFHLQRSQSLPWSNRVSPFGYHIQEWRTHLLQIKNLGQSSSIQV